MKEYHKSICRVTGAVVFSFLILFAFLLGTVDHDPNWPGYQEEAGLEKIQTYYYLAVLLHDEHVVLRKAYLDIGWEVGPDNKKLTEEDRIEIGRAVVHYAMLYNVPIDLIIAIINVESDGNIFAVSPAGAKGLMQLMPEWILPGEDVFDIKTNIRLGVTLLAANIKERGRTRGIQSYFWGNKKPSGTYLSKVEAALERLKEAG